MHKERGMPAGMFMNVNEQIRRLSTRDSPPVVQGFGTKRDSDIPVRAFVKSACGLMHEAEKEVAQYEQSTWPSFEQVNSPVALWGNLRGTKKIIDESTANGQDWYFFDHAYVMNICRFHKSSKKLGDKIYRVTKNAKILTVIDHLSDKDYSRIEKYHQHIHLKPWKRGGQYILVLEPSDHAKLWWNVPNWTEETLEKIRLTTNYEIRIRKKESHVPLDEDLKNAKCVVSHQSSAAIKAVISGVPSFCSDASAAYPVSQDIDMISHNLKNIEYFSEKYRQRWLNSILANQYTMKEISDGTCWRRLQDK